MYSIETERLKLIPLTHAQLNLLKQSRLLLENSMGLTLSSMQIDTFFINEFEDALCNFWLPNSQLYPDKYQWYTNWEIINKETNTSIGGIGFAGYPDNNGEAMTGYCIDQHQHNKGYGTEALAAITKWAFNCTELLALRIETGINNLPSQKIIVKCGFRQIASQNDKLTFEFKGQR